MTCLLKILTLLHEYQYDFRSSNVVRLVCPSKPSPKMTTLNRKVSVIVPSKNRAWLHRGVLSVFLKQSYTNIELLVADSGSNGPSQVFNDIQASNIHYFWLPNNPSVGAIRNFLVEKATGQIIVHFDDDDYYAPNYVSSMVELMNDYDFVTLSGWYNRDVRTGELFYWDTTVQERFQFVPGFSLSIDKPFTTQSRALEANIWGYGFSYVYKKALWERYRFPDVNFAEDIHFVNAFRTHAPSFHFADKECLIVHSLWENTLSSCFPQYRLPQFLLERINTDASHYYSSFHESPLQDNFVYFNETDSDGGDIAHIGKLSANELLQHCTEMEGIAVNTNGWVKDSIKPRENWTKLPHNSGGLWVKKSAIESMGLLRDL